MLYNGSDEKSEMIKVKVENCCLFGFSMLVELKKILTLSLTLVLLRATYQAGC